MRFPSIRQKIETLCSALEIAITCYRKAKFLFCALGRMQTKNECNVNERFGTHSDFWHWSTVYGENGLVRYLRSDKNNNNNKIPQTLCAHLHYNSFLEQWTIQCKCLVFATFAAHIQPILFFHSQQMRLHFMYCFT